MHRTNSRGSPRVRPLLGLYSRRPCCRRPLSGSPHIGITIQFRARKQPDTLPRQSRLRCRPGSTTIERFGPIAVSYKHGPRTCRSTRWVIRSIHTLRDLQCQYDPTWRRTTYAAAPFGHGNRVGVLVNSYGSGAARTVRIGLFFHMMVGLTDRKWGGSPLRRTQAQAPARFAGQRFFQLDPRVTSVPAEFAKTGVSRS